MGQQRERREPQIQEIAATSSQYNGTNLDGVSRHAKSQIGAGLVNDSNMQAAPEDISERVPNHRSNPIASKKQPVN